MDFEALEAQLAKLPLYGYFFLESNQLLFTERVRYICQHECQMYGKTWACPPAVGTVEECKKKCLSYPSFLMIATVTEVKDISDIEETLSTRGDHEAVTREAERMVQQQGMDTYTLSTEACAICETCAYPNGPCRHRDYMRPCIESHGIVLSEVAEECGLPFQYGDNVVTWFSLIFYKEKEK